MNELYNSLLAAGLSIWLSRSTLAASIVYDVQGENEQRNIRAINAKTQIRRDDEEWLSPKNKKNAISVTKENFNC